MEQKKSSSPSLNLCREDWRMSEFELATGGNGAPIQRWKELGWNVVDSHWVSTTLDEYRNYIEQSRGEFSVAKNLYTATRSGWFSCRTVCYLAAGRPCVVQDTGFSELVPTGEGLFAFDNLDQAAEAVMAVEKDYRRHCDAARQVAREHFDSKIVLRQMLEGIGMS